MDSPKKKSMFQEQPEQQLSPDDTGSHARIVTVQERPQCLDTVKLSKLEQSFRDWTENSARSDIRISRRRILIIFLLIRYTGGKLNEVLGLNPFEDIVYDRQLVLFRETDNDTEAGVREIQISEALACEIQSAISDPAFKYAPGNMFNVDPGFVRRKFYERAEACGFPRQMGGPEMIRKARAVELVQGNMPLPAVQKFLGHSTPNLTTSLVSFSEEEIRNITKLHMEREASRKTSARNSFFGKLHSIQRGDIQAKVELITIGGYRLTAIITNYSLENLGLRKGMLLTAEVKAPWVILQKTPEEAECSAENRFSGIVQQISTGEVCSEYIVALSDGTELCSIVSTESMRRMGLKKGDRVRALFNCFAVILHAG